MHEVLRRFDRETGWLATGVLGSVVFAAILVAVQVREHQKDAINLPVEATQVGVDRPLISVPQTVEPATATPDLALNSDVSHQNVQANRPLRASPPAAGCLAAAWLGRLCQAKAGMINSGVTDKLVDNTPRGRMRALYEWLTGAEPPPSSSTPSNESTREILPARIGHYAIARKLGEGGMGVVYAARDERLERTVALKTMSSLADDETARKRFWREARAAASVNHPNVCQIYEIGEDDGAAVHRDGAARGRVAGASGSGADRSASTRRCRSRSRCWPRCGALHARGIVHRDLKPSNVFLTPHGVKLLDFGLARPARTPPSSSASA